MKKRRRGRPLSFDPGVALGAALGAFWKGGFTGTSLDDISAATGLNRPSLFRAFGDKKSIYRKALAKFSDEFLGELEAALFGGAGLEEDLVNFYMKALSTYRSGRGDALGCPVICTATTEAALDDDIQADLAAALDRIDRALETRFAQSLDRGELPQTADPGNLGRLAGALLHSLAVRLRARQSGFDAEGFIRKSVAEILRP